MSEYGRGNLVIPCGTDWTRIFTYKDPAGALINLTGYHARMQFRASVDAATAILSLGDESPLSGITLGGALGTIQVDLTHAQLTEGSGGLDLSTITADPGWLLETFDDGTRLKGFGPLAVFDVELIDPAGKVDRLYQGQAVFDREVTRG